MCVKRRLQGAHLVEQDAHGPDVRLEGLLLSLHNFRRELVRRPDHGLDHLVGVGQHLCNPEVPEFDHVALGQEDVLALQVPVQHFAVVDVLHREADLHELVEDHVFLKEVAALARRNLLGEVTSVGLVHHYAQLALLGFVNFPEFDNVRVV